MELFCNGVHCIVKGCYENIVIFAGAGISTEGKKVYKIKAVRKKFFTPEVC